MGWIIGLSIAALLLSMPLGVGASYNADGGALWLTVGLLKIPLLPRAKSKEKRKKPEKEKVKKEETGGSYTDLLPLIENVIALLSDLRRKLVITKLRGKLILAGGDPCDLGVNYGRAWAAMGTLIPLLEQIFVIKKRDLSVDCDFTADTTLVIFHIHGRITLIRLLTIVVVHGVSILRKYFTIMNNRKGGANI